MVSWWSSISSLGRGSTRSRYVQFQNVRRGLISDNDISGGSFGIRQVKLTLNGAFSMLQEALCQRARTMVGDKEWYRAGDDDPEELTILGKVMGVTREVSHIL
jgi:hypothetical protein